MRRKYLTHSAENDNNAGPGSERSMRNRRESLTPIFDVDWLTAFSITSVFRFGLTPGQIAKTAWVPRLRGQKEAEPTRLRPCGTPRRPPSATVQLPCSAGDRLRLPCCPQRPSICNELTLLYTSWFCDVIKPHPSPVLRRSRPYL